MNPKVECKYCGSYVTKNNIERHEKSCLENNKHKTKFSINNDWCINNKWTCPYCKKEYKSKQGLVSHIWRSHYEDGKKHNPNVGCKVINRVSWNKGLTKETDIRIKEQAEKSIERFASGERIKNFSGKKHSEESKRKISEAMSLNNKGGKCKWFKYMRKSDNKEFSLQGTWEVRFAKVLDELDPLWIKIGINNGNHSMKWVDENNKEHTYTPDFWCPSLNKYFEVKGYFRDVDKIKMEKVFEQNIHINLVVVMKDDLLEYEKKLMVR